jgi:hypothetical protein
MRNTILATIAVATLSMTSFASAADFNTSGVVESVNSLTKTVQIVNGDAFKLPGDADINGLTAGQKVQINWSTQTPSWYTDHTQDRDIAQFNANSISIAN